MSEKGGQGASEGREQYPPVEESPTEKLEDSGQAGAKVPGSQTAEHAPVKDEVNPNTE